MANQLLPGTVSTQLWPSVGGSGPMEMSTEPSWFGGEVPVLAGHRRSVRVVSSSGHPSKNRNVPNRVATSSGTSIPDGIGVVVACDGIAFLLI